MAWEPYTCMKLYFVTMQCKPFINFSTIKYLTLCLTGILSNFDRLTCQNLRHLYNNCGQISYINFISICYMVTPHAYNTVHKHIMHTTQYTNTSCIQHSTQIHHAYNTVHKYIMHTTQYTNTSCIQHSTQIHHAYNTVHKHIMHTTQYTNTSCIQHSTQTHHAYNTVHKHIMHTTQYTNTSCIQHSTQTHHAYNTVHKHIMHTTQYTNTSCIQHSTFASFMQYQMPFEFLT